MAEKKLNLDIPESVSEFEILIKKVLPKNIIYQLVYGKGVEFDGYRDFTPSDDAGNIDWKASVRSQKTLVRKYIEERDLKFLFLIDVSDNMIFGSTEKLKCEYAAELSAALAHIILISGDRVGFVLFNDEIVKIMLHGLGEKFFNIFSYELSDPLNYGGVSDLNNVLKTLLERIDRSTSMVFVVSDFISMNENNKKNIELLSSLFETIAIVIKDPLDKSLPNVNKELVIESSKTNEKILINPKIAKYAYQVNTLSQENNLKKMFRDFNIDFLELTTDVPFSLNLAEFLKERTKRRIYVRKDVH